MRFDENDVRRMGRTAAGVRGIRMPSDDDSVIGLIVVGDGTILSATSNGFGKRTAASDYPTKGRGGQGVIDIKTTDRNGPVIGAVQVSDSDEIMLITNGGTLVRTAVAEVTTVGRNTQGVRLIRLSKGENLVELTAIDEADAVAEDALEDIDEADAGDGESASASPVDAGAAGDDADAREGGDDGSDDDRDDDRN